MNSVESIAGSGARHQLVGVDAAGDVLLCVGLASATRRSRSALVVVAVLDVAIPVSSRPSFWLKSIRLSENGVGGWIAISSMGGGKKLGMWFGSPF